MTKYIATTLLFSISKGKYIQPGETVEYDDPKVAETMLEAGLVKPFDEAAIPEKPKSKVVGGEA